MFSFIAFLKKGFYDKTTGTCSYLHKTCNALFFFDIFSYFEKCFSLLFFLFKWFVCSMGGSARAPQLKYFITAMNFSIFETKLLLYTSPISLSLC